jgi:uncharacterized protein (DUF1330 family)
MSETYIHPAADQIAAIRDMTINGPVTMLNLLRFNPDGGAEAYARYGAEAAPFLERSGAKLRYLGNVAATVIGGEACDRIILVEYPSRQAFLEMSGDPGYPAALRAEALVDSRLYCTQETSQVHQQSWRSSVTPDLERTATFIDHR